ncbi:HAMP domain-containing sensor histidine kinase [Thermoanaerobacterium thermosaccharolyticum]|uniref:HAMP domain-containing sensor histidine kinase n=1 Tax=Thermoanaerobacterium thermosaccharolyticum TaxID=1517 RepID=UPI00123B5C02|nr:ATP-binding protein [Thermoanaerobacterium thermosaccharolyticum]KAA5806797.1 cell wall metabolism sensor histidine kinase WalK [Thermoanaerobacterium thermosaccharolyticum]
MKIRTKILICYISAFTVTIILIGYFMFNIITNYIVKNTVNNLIDSLNREIYLAEDNITDPEILLREYADNIALNLSGNNIFVKLYDNKTLISHLENDLDNLNNRSKNNKIDVVVENALNGSKVYKVDRNVLYLALPIKFGNEIIGAVEYIYPLKNELMNINFIKMIFEVFGLVSVIIIFLVSFYISRIITKPIKRLDSAAKNFSDGNFEIIPIITKDEIGNLTRTFNQMAKIISKQIRDIAIEKNKLNSVLSGLSEGVIAFNEKRDSIVFKNQKVDELIGENIQNYIFDIVDKTYKDKRIIEELQVNGKILNIESFLCDGYCIIVIKDVTLDKELIEKQKKFVSNISHELKTPITTIIGFIQILKDGKKYDQDVLNYLESEANKLKKLVLEILELSRLQSYELKLQKKTVNLSHMLLNICENINLKASKFDISIKIKVQNGINVIVDEDKVSQAIINILDNAIKYSKPHQQIDVLLYKNCNQDIVIEIKDHGIGIPENEICHIFDRFYRAKNALSIGGNGLGLTIVKEIIEKHGGKIEVVSTINSGSTFRMVLPQNS